ncbi:hypothetical protein TCAL_04535 [Tigriopus californicus]|uniref:Cytochrome P450 n=2 Tax=Tigriopus californicus TaxID=6832 RepID=A0A553PAW2_TIGCA|nr:hypothetical protein TCAL_04535 [Tigriopus californicus]|eukprot:TCALIF_04535-PA protein Name:"Similar to sad Cytochrome P450 315a1, mitochondrial (Drosophila melanogaster)" AED:0.34 eAED:0.37 QI:0/-1/0/1/-1/1/1/0/469
MLKATLSLRGTLFHGPPRASFCRSNHIIYMKVLDGTTMEEAKIPPTSHIHRHNQASHHRMGPLFRQYFSYCSEGLWVGCKDLVREVSHAPHITPMCIYPVMWRLFEEKSGVKRGLSMNDLDAWHSNEAALKSLVINPTGLNHPMHPLISAQRLTDKWKSRNGSFTPHFDLEIWAIESSLTYLFGDSIDLFDTQLYHYCLKQMKKNIVALNLSFCPEEAALESSIWEGFKEAGVQALRMGREFSAATRESGGSGLVHQMRASGLWSEDDLNSLLADVLMNSSVNLMKTAMWIVHVMSSSTSIAEHLAKNSNDIGYIRLLLNETFRFFPVTPYLTKMNTEVLKLGGWEIPKGHLMIMSYFTLAQEEFFWQSDKYFWPERWDHCYDRDVNWRFSYSTLPIGFKINDCAFLKMTEEQLIPLVQVLASNLSLEQSNMTKYPDTKRAMDLSGLPSQPLVIQTNLRQANMRLHSML